MALRDQIIGDYLLWDNRETITFRSRDSAGNGTDRTLTDCKRRVLTTKELAASNGRYTGADLVWLVPTTILTGAGETAIKPYDTITDSGSTQYVVLEAAEQGLRTFWRLVTRNMVIANQLYDTVNVQHPTITQTAAGHRSVTWATNATSVHCRVQPRQTDVFDDRGVRSTRTVYDVYFASGINATNSDGDMARLVWGTVNLQIVNYTQAERIDALPMAECHKVP